METGDKRGESFGGCGFREKSKKDGFHDSSAMENSGLQERLSIQEIDRGAAENGSLDDSVNGGGLLTPKSKRENAWEVDIGK